MIQLKNIVRNWTFNGMEKVQFYAQNKVRLFSYTPPTSITTSLQETNEKHLITKVKNSIFGYDNRIWMITCSFTLNQSGKEIE